MAYSMYIDGVQMPITPSKIEIKISNQNKSLNLIDGSEINMLKSAGLSKVSFELLLPQVSYPFAVGNQKADYYLSLFERLKTSKKAFQWILNRNKPNGVPLFYTNMTVSLEDYSIVDDASKGFDITVKINLKQYKTYATKTVTIQQPKKEEKPVAKVESPPRETKPTPRTYTVKTGDCLWNIAKKELGNGTRYEEIYQLNKAQIDKRNAGTGNSKYTIYTGQVFTLPSK